MKRVTDVAGDLAPVVAAVLLAVPVIVAGLFFVWTRVATVRVGYEIGRLSETHRTLIEENRGLRIEVASLKAPGRLEPLAREHYGLRPPKPEQIIRLRKPRLAARAGGEAE